MAKGRPLGSKNKPQYVTVKLSDLVTALQPNSNVVVKRDFAEALFGVEEDKDIDTSVEVSAPIVVKHNPGE